METLKFKAQDRYARTKTAFSSRENFYKALCVEPSQGFAPQTGGWVWSNSHTDPTPPHERTCESAMPRQK